MFQLNDEFIHSYRDKEPPWGPVGYVTYKRTYARPLDSISERHAGLAASAGLTESEEWWLTVARVVEGTYEIQRKHCLNHKVKWDEKKAQASAEEMYRLIFNFKFTPPGRGLWMMGTPVVEKIGGAALNNCAFVSTEKTGTDPFTFLMDMSMLGVGVGFDTLGADKIRIHKKYEEETADDFGLYRIPDTREGWVNTLYFTLAEYFTGWSKYEFDYSLIRPYGTPIKGFGGTASGPEPLKQMVASIRELLEARRGEFLSSTDIVDLMNLIGRCVVAGNVRRSAELAIGSPYDENFLNLKDYNLYPEQCKNWRWASNNSVAATVGMDYSDVAERTALNGEPGYIWLDNARNYSRMGRPPDMSDTKVVGVNPCSEQSLEDRELCCLVEVFPSLHEDYSEIENTLKYAYLYAKTVTMVPTHNEDTNAVMLRNRRIGVSMTGIVPARVKFGSRRFLFMLERGYEFLRYKDRQYSDWLAIPLSRKITSVKPAGSVSLLAGVSAGIHHPESEYYYRVIRFASESPLLDKLKEAGYKWYDLTPAEPNTTAVYFPVKEQFYERGKRDVTMWEQLEMAAQMQEYWADNQVSVTVTFKPEEAGDIKYALECYETRLKSVSFLPLVEHGYSHAPYQPITKEEYEVYSSSVKPITRSSTKSEVQPERFCDGDTCTL